MVPISEEADGSNASSQRIDCVHIDKYIRIIYIFEFILFADFCGRSGRVVTFYLFTGIDTSDTFDRSR